MAGLSLQGPPVRAAAPDSSDSYWGPIPAAPDTVCAPLADRPKPAWEQAILVPYRVVTFPIALTSRGIGSGIGYLDEHSVIQDVVRLLGPRQGPFGFILDFRLGGLSGFGGGLTAEHPRFLGEPNTLRVRGSTTSKHDHRLGIAARFGAASRSYAEFGAGYRQRPNVRFFGFGPEAREEDESFFHQETGWVGATVRRPLGGASHVDVGLEYTTVATGMPGSDHDPPTQDLFATTPLPAYGRHSYGVTASAQWMHESAGLTNRPGRGGIRRLRASYFEGVDRADARFWTFRGEAQQFFTLWRPLRVLAVRGFASWMENKGGDDIPLARQNNNDDPDLLRGYYDFRWRDRGLLIASAEYRWPVWTHQRPTGPGVDAYLLTDAGQVFGHADEISMANVTLSYGGGLRIESGRGFVFRVEYAQSEETSVLRFRADQVFQFTKSGFLYGREPIPDR